jgi:hypothetical protein
VITSLDLSHNSKNFKVPGVLTPVPEINEPLGLIKLALIPKPPSLASILADFFNV